MILGYRREGRKLYLLVGLSQGNLDRLAAGSPIHAERATHGSGIPEDLVLEIHYGPTEDELAHTLEAAGIIRGTTRREDRRKQP